MSYGFICGSSPAHNLNDVLAPDLALLGGLPQYANVNTYLAARQEPGLIPSFPAMGVNEQKEAVDERGTTTGWRDGFQAPVEAWDARVEEGARMVLPTKALF